MEVKINKEIRQYTEAIYFGLSLRQLLCAGLGVVVAVGLYLFLRPILGLEVTSWLCILAMAPFATLGFLRYHGMPAEQIAMAWISSEVLTPRRLIHRPYNFFEGSNFLLNAKKHR